MVNCVMLKHEAPGLEAPPHPGEVGQRVYENVSQEAWDEWLQRLQMIINENQLNTADPRSLELEPSLTLVVHTHQARQLEHSLVPASLVELDTRVVITKPERFRASEASRVDRRRIALDPSCEHLGLLATPADDHGRGLGQIARTVLPHVEPRPHATVDQALT